MSVAEGAAAMPTAQSQGPGVAAASAGLRSVVMSADSSVPPAPRLADIRSRWLGAAVAGLHADPAVAGACLVGSLGADRADDWSDIDLLIVVDDAVLDDCAAPDRLSFGLGKPAVAFDARHNGPRGTRAVSGQYLVDGLPLWVDWHIHPISKAIIKHCGWRLSRSRASGSPAGHRKRPG
ncbi:nucleotidyltransferase domain-containing protein [Nonomuraea sp. NPDC049400]|uniref:nucleotidyltransferase domain-containing protein n=1 Tax=Nonomuraea sp. NPDC049400 TaxID=3364352 RepID=UPI0037AF21F7